MKTNKIRTTYWVIAALLMVGAVTANQFSAEFTWDKYDFLIFGIMLLGAGLAIELVLHFAQKPKYRLGLIGAVVVVFLFVWAELAVGIFH